MGQNTVERHFQRQTKKHRQTDRHTDGVKNRQTDRGTDRQTDRQRFPFKSLIFVSNIFLRMSLFLCLFQIIELGYIMWNTKIYLLPVGIMSLYI